MGAAKNACCACSTVVFFSFNQSYYCFVELTSPSSFIKRPMAAKNVFFCLCANETH